MVSIIRKLVACALLLTAGVLSVPSVRFTWESSNSPEVHVRKKFKYKEEHDEYEENKHVDLEDMQKAGEMATKYLSDKYNKNFKVVDTTDREKNSSGCVQIKCISADLDRPFSVYVDIDNWNTVSDYYADAVINMDINGITTTAITGTENSDWCYVLSNVHTKEGYVLHRAEKGFGDAYEWATDAVHLYVLVEDPDKLETVYKQISKLTNGNKYIDYITVTYVEPGGVANAKWEVKNGNSNELRKNMLQKCKEIIVYDSTYKMIDYDTYKTSLIA